MASSSSPILSLSSSSSSPSSYYYFLVLIVLLQLIKSSQSLLTCNSSQILSKNNKKLQFDHCNDLPKLSSILHWTYRSSESSLSIAFVATPPSPDGWIAWAINPTGTGMIGAQSLIAFRQADGLMTVKTFNVSSYEAIEPSVIAFETSEMEAEIVVGVMRLYAKIGLKTAMVVAPEVVNQVWQVGPAVVDGIPAVHGFGPENLNSMGTLDLMKGESGGGGGAGGGANSKQRNKSVS